MSLNRETVIKALEGVLLIQYPTLWDDNGNPTDEHIMAIKAVHENLSQFQQIVQEELKKFPNTEKFLGHLISARLFQNKPLESPIIQKLFPLGPTELENRLSRILCVTNVEEISINAHGPKDPRKGDDTDDIIRDIWTEFFVADFLVTTLKTNYVEKLVRGKSQPAIEFYVQWKSEEWIVEVARLRKRDFQGETMPWGSLDCTRPDNVKVIQKALRLKIFDKNKQIQKFVSQEKRDFNRRIVVIKTSQEEYQDCKRVIIEEAKRILNERTYPEITHLLLIYDTGTYEFVENLQAR